jgi:hypothetical protein
MAMAIRGPRPSIELKLRSAARLAVFVSENVVADRRDDPQQGVEPAPASGREIDACQMSLFQRRTSRFRCPWAAFQAVRRQQEVRGSRRSEPTPSAETMRTGSMSTQTVAK